MRPALPIVLAAAVLVAGCNPDTPPVPTTPAPITTETFSGTVSVGGKDQHNFTVQLSNGLLTMTLTAASPVVSLGMGLGQPDDTGACVLLSNAAVATLPGAIPQLSGQVNAGNYCASLFDPGGLAGPVTYSVTVTHY